MGGAQRPVVPVVAGRPEPQAARITRLVLTQFESGATIRRTSYPMRNVVMSWTWRHDLRRVRL